MHSISSALVTCTLLLAVNAYLAASAVNISQTAVSQTYEGVHLSEALQKATEGEGDLEDLLHWAIGQECQCICTALPHRLHEDQIRLICVTYCRAQ